MANGECEQHDEEHGVAGHLQAEVADLLQRNRENAGYRSDSDPVVHTLRNFSHLDLVREGRSVQTRTWGIDARASPSIAGMGL